MDCRGKPGDDKIEGFQLNSTTKPATIRQQPIKAIIGQLMRGRSERPCARRSVMRAVSYSSDEENMQPKPLRAEAAAVSSATSAALELLLRAVPMATSLSLKW